MNVHHLLNRVFPTSRKLLVERSLYSLKPLVYDKVLIVGAGTDPYRNLFQQTTQYIRLDIGRVPRCTDVVADALALPFASSHFDCILASEVMEHLRDPFVFVKELSRTLKPGGAIILTVPFIFHQHADPFDYWRPTRHALEELFSSFASVKIDPQGNRLHVIWDMVTTAFFPTPLLFPLRIFNHLLVRFYVRHRTARGQGGTAPSGFLVVARK